jgi:hypothetical protein
MSRAPAPPSERAELLVAFADASDALFDAGIIRSDSFTGDIGEFVASRTLGFDLVGRNVAAIDGTGHGLRYQVKSVASDEPQATIPLVHLVPGWDVLVGVRLSLRFDPLELIEIELPDFPPDTRALRESLLAAIPCRRRTTFPRAVTAAAPLLSRFGAAYEALQANGVITTRHIVSDVGAGYAAEALGLTLMADPTNAGYDAVDAAGTTYEIKTRRVYESGRRTSSTRRVNGLVGKTAVVLVVVSLDREFCCSGMWAMPLRNVVNARSANMRSVLRTPGIRQIR